MNENSLASLPPQISLLSRFVRGEEGGRCLVLGTYFILFFIFIFYFLIFFSLAELHLVCNSLQQLPPEIGFSLFLFFSFSPLSPLSPLLSLLFTFLKIYFFLHRGPSFSSYSYVGSKYAGRFFFFFFISFSLFLFPPPFFFCFFFLFSLSPPFFLFLFLEIPPEIGKLSSLTFLSLTDNEVFFFSLPSSPLSISLPPHFFPSLLYFLTPPPSPSPPLSLFLPTVDGLPRHLSGIKASWSIKGLFFFFFFFFPDSSVFYFFFSFSFS